MAKKTKPQAKAVSKPLTPEELPEQVLAVQPPDDGLPVIRFTAAQDFYSEETRSHYLKGFSYTARAGDTVLRGLIPKWISESKIVEGGQQATMTGQGRVQ